MSVITELKKEMRKYRGSIHRTALRARCSTQWVHYVLNGEQESEKVLSAALAIVAEMQQEQQEREEKKAELQAQIKKALACY